jgi:ABC-type branched-subunit amino acid transport system substrate-binding protein
VLAPNDAYGSKVRDTLKEMYTKKGGLVSPAELYAPSPANIDAAVARLAASYSNTPEDRRFQAIFLADGGNQLKTIMSSFKKHNIDLTKIKLLGTGLWDTEEVSKIPGMTGAWFSTSPPEDYRIFDKRFETAYGYRPARLSSLAYDAVALVAKLSMPMTNPSALSDAQLTYPQGYFSPANGLFRFSEDGTSDRRLAILEVTPTGFKVIEPAEKKF